MTEHPGDSDDDLAHAGREVPDLSGAYAELMKGITINAIPAQKLQEMSANFSKAAGLDKLAGIFDTSPMTSFFPNGIVPQALRTSTLIHRQSTLRHRAPHRTPSAWLRRSRTNTPPSHSSLA